MENHRRSNSGPVLNPIILERKERERLVAAAATASPSKVTGGQNNNNGDDLWGSDEEETVAAAAIEEEDDDDDPMPKKKKARDSSKTRKRRSSGSTSQNSQQKKTPTKKTSRRQSLSDDDDDDDVDNYHVVTYDDDLCPINKKLRNAMKQGDMEALESMAHPTLKFPSFTSEFEPLVMETDKGRHSVPASISRYLGDYQKDGVTFLHKCYTSKMGGILGDEMVNWNEIYILKECIVSPSLALDSRVSLQRFCFSSYQTQRALVKQFKPLAFCVHYMVRLGQVLTV